jgi:hypothetical protein
MPARTGPYSCIVECPPQHPVPSAPMEVLHGTGSLPIEGESAATIGFFDGVHRGHQAVIGGAVEGRPGAGPPAGGRHVRPPSSGDPVTRQDPQAPDHAPPEGRAHRGARDLPVDGDGCAQQRAEERDHRDDDSRVHQTPVQASELAVRRMLQDGRGGICGAPDALKR